MTLAESDRDRLLQVFGHIRSGNNLLAACLHLNFYPGSNLKGDDGYFGHWSDRQFAQGSTYGKLIGNHEHWAKASATRRAVYIHRDGRSVAYSVWRSAHFMNSAWLGIPFSEFLRRPIDWDATPGRRRQSRWYHQRRENIVEHWRRHITGWLGSGDKNICFVRYEDLVVDPARVILGISKFFDMQVAEPARSQGVEVPKQPVGYSPNQGSNKAWMDAFSDEDLVFYRSIVGEDVDRLRAAHPVYLGQSLPRPPSR